MEPIPPLNSVIQGPGYAEQGHAGDINHLPWFILIIISLIIIALVITFTNHEFSTSNLLLLHFGFTVTLNVLKPG